MVGGRSFTAIGKPTVPWARVKATVEQQTAAGEKLVFKYKAKRRSHHFWRRRQLVTMLRIDEIEVDHNQISAQKDMEKEKAMRPDRILDMWANRFLTEEEKVLIPRDQVG